jgi:hypothetical protein
MKKITIILFLFAAILHLNSIAQRVYFSENERHGNTLNLGAGIGGYSGYTGYSGRSLPVFTINYEYQVLNDLTIAPFASLYSYRNITDHYRETIIPIGIKSSLYFDQLLKAKSRWDLYLAGSLGFSITNSTWDKGYSGETYYHDISPVFIGLHIGTEYHLTGRIGIFMELATGVSTIGLAFHRF